MAVKWTAENITRLSDMYYNMGLEKAGEKDFTAAVTDLRKAIRLNSANIHARNLLGLVCYQTGEFVEALTQWVVSDTLQKEGNLAAYFLDRVQMNSAELHNIEMALGYYNRAVYMVEEGSDDLAIMQLRKVVDLYPGFLKAYQLLALLYLRRRSYSRAERVLRRAMRYDAYNPDTARYLNELRVIAIRRQRKGSEEEQWNWEEEAFRHISGDDVIRPSRLPNLRMSWSSVLFLAIGAVCAALICMRAVLPQRTRALNEEINRLTVSQAGGENSWRAQAERLQARVDELEGQVTDLEGDAVDAATLNGRLTAYRELTSVLWYMEAEDPASACLHLLQIDASQVPQSETVFQTAYSEQYAALYPNAQDLLVNAGQSLCEAGEYDRAAEFLRAALGVNEDATSAMYWLVKVYQGSGDETQAQEWTDKLLNEYPSSSEAQLLDAELNPPAAEPEG